VPKDKPKPRSGHAVGYCCPPKTTRFKKGRSGNPNGPPKGSKNLATLFHNELKQRVVISENGQRRTITKAEAAVKHLINRAATGDAKAIQATINLAKELGDLRLPDPQQQPTVQRITLKVFEKDLKTGERVRVRPMSS
jgi:hypothetical protein